MSIRTIQHNPPRERVRKARTIWVDKADFDRYKSLKGKAKLALHMKLFYSGGYSPALVGAVETLHPLLPGTIPRGMAAGEPLHRTLNLTVGEA